MNFVEFDLFHENADLFAPRYIFFFRLPNRMTAVTIPMSRSHAEISNVNQANSNAKITNALIQLKFAMDKINVVTIRKRVRTVIGSSVLRSTLNAVHRPTEPLSALRTHSDAMEFR